MRSLILGTCLLIHSGAAYLPSFDAPSTTGSRRCRHIARRASNVALEATSTRGALRAKIISIGAATPPTLVTNSQLEAVVDTSDEWIAKRTGIRSRRLLAPGEGLTGLASEAVDKALAQAGVPPEDVELLIMATSSPDDLFGDAAAVARASGATNAVAFDLTAACSGFLFGVNTASQFLHNGAYSTAVVVGADALSRWVDWTDRNTCVLFGDGAGAAVLKAAADDEPCGLLGYEMHSNGAGRPNLNLGYDGPSNMLGASEEADSSIATVTTGEYACIAMNGKEVYKFATSKVPAVLKEALANADVKAEEIDWLLLHQANIRIMETVADKLGIPMEKVITNLDEYGNTSAGSIPIALDQAVREGKVKPGDVIATAGFGAGLSWGAAIIRWG